jgi:glutamate synthase domain-containing protein 2
MVPRIGKKEVKAGDLPEGIRMVELDWDENWSERIESLNADRPDLMLSVKVPVSLGMEEKALSLVKGGVSIIHIEADKSARFQDDDSRHLKEAIRSLHLKLIDEKIRERVSILASGGIAMAEHVAKALICGVDAVYIDSALLVALECRLCRRCRNDLSCPVDLGDAPSDWVCSRAINLMGAWHNQLLEVMGAMGIRDARRLRGEAGRAIFFDELDRETFGELGALEEDCELE